MVAEYAHCYGHRPDPGMPWPEFRALVRRVTRFEARALLHAITAARLRNSEGPLVQLEALATGRPVRHLLIPNAGGPVDG